MSAYETIYLMVMVSMFIVSLISLVIVLIKSITGTKK